MSYPFFKQLNAMDCGPTCLRMIARYFGKNYNGDSLRQWTGFGRQGVSMLGITEAAERIGFNTRSLKISYDQLVQINAPCVLHWDQNHFVVLYKIKNKSFIQIADPAKGMIIYNKKEFLSHWISSKNYEKEDSGIALLLSPSPDFYKQAGEKESKLNWKLAIHYLRSSRRQLFQVFIAFIITTLIQLAFPFLTQSIVDVGISGQNIQFIVIVLIAQLMLTFSTTIVDFIRNRLLLKIANVVNLAILSDFWIKLTRLPVSYFNTHQTGDTIQRIGDHRQIQSFLMGSTLNVIFSSFTFLVYAVILIFFNSQLFFLFIAGSIFYFLWVRLFLGIRRKINYQSFYLSAKENEMTLQLVQGMQEIRLNNAERFKRWKWENIQVQLFKLSLTGLNYNQIQQTGALFINKSKDLLISFLVAQMVVEGRLTLGTMMAVQYIIGQLSSPIEQWINFVQSGQDAKISMERLNEVHEISDEEPIDKTFLKRLPESKVIDINNLSFSYPGAGNEPVLDNISLHIPEGKITAIVGVSGSGKTTLLKLLLKFYDQYEGDISIGESNFKYLSPSFWRSKCGAVLQDGFLFNDTIAGNIAVGDMDIDFEKMIKACKIANILSFIESLPNSFHTQLGSDGVGVSQGQRQRLLIARAVYKDPTYLFFDEATNALDANNEKTIVENLNEFFEGRTVVIVAHRLSTVRDADKIIVIHEGRIVEEGSHIYLTALQGKYYELVKNQLELGN